MRLTRYITLATLACTMILAPVAANAAASKEMLDLQRDVADLTQQIKDFQKASDAQFAALQAQLQQALDTANRTNTSVGNMNDGLMRTLQTELKSVKDQLNSVTGLSVKVDNTSNDVSDLKSSIQSLVNVVNKQQTLLNDINLQLKVLSAPPVAPPAAGGSAPGTPAAAAQPTAESLFNNGVRDMNAGHPEIALPEFTEFLHLYPDDANAAGVQYHIGEIHYQQGNSEQAVKDFDAVIEKYSPDQQLTPEAYYMKGLALRRAKKPAEAIKAFRDVVAQFPRSGAAGQAKTQLTEMGANKPAPRKK